MLWAMQNPDKVEKMVVLNTPLGSKSKLRPELAAYKNRMAFLRPDPQVPLCMHIHMGATVFGSIMYSLLRQVQLPTDLHHDLQRVCNQHAVKFSCDWQGHVNGSGTVIIGRKCCLKSVLLPSTVLHA